MVKANAGAASVSRRSALCAGMAAPLVAVDARAEPALCAEVDALIARCEQQARLFNAGDMAGWLASDDLVMLAYIERQQIAVAGLPRQDWSLRVTQIFQRDGADWKLLHRHADPLVRSINLATAAALAAGGGLTAVQGGW